MLGLMCLVPIVTISVLWQIMPPPLEGELDVAVRREGVPALDYYLVDIAERHDVSQSTLVLRNVGEYELRHIFVKVNHHYNIRDDMSLPPGAERAYLLNRFVSRTGARYDLRQLPLRDVRVFAKQVETGKRATFNEEFPNMIKKR